MIHQRRSTSRRHDGSRRLAARLSALAERIGFWAAVALPTLYVPAMALGVDLPGDPFAELGLVGLNVAALVVGHGHEPRGTDGAT